MAEFTIDDWREENCKLRALVNRYQDLWAKAANERDILEDWIAYNTDVYVEDIYEEYKEEEC